MKPHFHLLPILVVLALPELLCTACKRQGVPVEEASTVPSVDATVIMPAVQSKLNSIVFERKDKVTFRDVYQLLESTDIKELTTAQQLELLAHLRAEGMKPEEWERTVEFLTKQCTDVKNMLEFAALLDAGPVRNGIYNQAFSKAEKSDLPAFLKVLRAVQNDDIRKQWLEDLIARTIGPDNFDEAVKWADELVTNDDKRIRSLSVLNGLDRRIRNIKIEADLEVIPFSQIAAAFSPDDISQVGQDYCAYYLAKGDTTAIEGVIDSLPPYMKVSILSQSISEANVITSDQAASLKALIPADDSDYAGFMAILVDSVARSEGKEAADAFRSDRLSESEREAATSYKLKYSPTPESGTSQSDDPFAQ